MVIRRCNLAAFHLAFLEDNSIYNAYFILFPDKNILLLSIPTIHVMGNKNSQLLLIFLIEFLVLVDHGTSCRHTQRSASNRETEHSSMFLQALSSIFKASESSTDKIKAVVHTVSRRPVPSGPNPLHN
ncbi:hypothetical protein IMY05_015G0119200 [Salix suchowensis]|nr:hypothetical protein IMY05_015G0119200 [Salix suchowensis]